MRKKGVIGLLVVLLIFAGIAFLLSDRFIERGLESAGESIVEAKVEIDNLNFSPGGLSISMDRLQVTNPNDGWKNLFEAGRISFDMEATSLMKKKIIINDVTLADLRFGTKRETDGSIPQKPGEAGPGWLNSAKASLTKEIESVPILNLAILKKEINVDNLMAMTDIQSVARIEQVRQNADSTYRHVNELISGFKPKHDFLKLEQDIKSITSTDPKNVQQLAAALEKTKRARNTLDQIKNDFATIKMTSTSGLSNITSAVGQFDKWISEDLTAVKQLAKIGDFSPQNVGKMLFGKVTILPTLGLLDYVAKAREYMPLVQKVLKSGKVEKPPRFAGQDIRFPVLDGLPEFLIEQIAISGSSNQADTSAVISASGEIHGVTSRPQTYGKPTTFALNATLPQYIFDLKGELDHTTDVAKDRFELRAGGIPIGNIALPSQPHLPSSIIANSGDITAKFEMIGEELDFGFTLNAKPVRFDFAESDPAGDVISKITRSVFDEIQDLQLGVSIKGPVNNLSLKINSNIDNILSQRIRNLIGESAQQARAKIERRVNAVVEPKKNEALAFISKGQNKISSEVSNIEKEISEKLAVLDQKKKEIEKKMEEKKKEGLEGAADKLKGLFKKNKN